MIYTRVILIKILPWSEGRVSLSQTVRPGGGGGGGGPLGQLRLPGAPARADPLPVPVGGEV